MSILRTTVTAIVLLMPLAVTAGDISSEIMSDADAMRAATYSDN